MGRESRKFLWDPSTLLGAIRASGSLCALFALLHTSVSLAPASRNTTGINTSFALKVESILELCYRG